METHDEGVRKNRRNGIVHYIYVLWLTGLYLADTCLDWALAHLVRMRRESDLFLGIALATIGALSFHAGRYCDGNSADYLSCTRPAVYYYYPAFDTALIIIGVFLIVLWFLARRRGE